MSPELPERASLEFLKKLAKERLRELRRRDPEARLAAAQLAVLISLHRETPFRKPGRFQQRFEHVASARVGILPGRGMAAFRVTGQLQPMTSPGWLIHNAMKDLDALHHRLEATKDHADVQES